MQRVTQLHMTNQFVNDLNSIYSKLADKQREVSTGRRIDTPSDDPFGTAQVLTFDAQLSDVAQYQRNVDDALSFLDTGDSALQGVSGTLIRIRELVVQGSSTTLDQNARNSIAAEVRQLKESIRDQANTQYGDTYIFSGTATTTQPYPAPANAFQGNLGVINRRVSPGLQVGINVNGPAVFGTTTGVLPTQLDMLDLIDRIAADLTSGVPLDLEELRTSCLDGLDMQLNNVTRELANIGSASARMEVTAERLSDLDGRISEARSTLADADMAKAYMEYQTQNTMYQSALAAGSRLMQTSLLDFL